MTFQLKPRAVILFDLDGTLLPMNEDLFTKIYFQGLCTTLKDIIEPQKLIDSVWSGMKAMVTNNGKQTNREVFGQTFTKISGIDYFENEETFMKFYQDAFQNCQQACQIQTLSKDIVYTLKQKGYKVAIATNPIFPQIATYSRLKWLDINPNDFPLVTTFENSYSAKPNPQYYKEVCQKLSVKPKDCIMIGNDVEEDGIALSLGMEVCLITDCLLNKKGLPTHCFEKGSLEELYRWVQELADQHS